MRLQRYGRNSAWNFESDSLSMTFRHAAATRRARSRSRLARPYTSGVWARPSPVLQERLTRSGRAFPCSRFHRLPTPGMRVPALPVRRSTRPSHRPAPAPPPGVRPMSRPRPLPSKRCCASACSRSPADTKMPSRRYIFPLTLTVLADVEWKVTTMRRVGINLRELRQKRRESTRLDYGNKSRRHFPHLVCLSILVIFPAYPK